MHEEMHTRIQKCTIFFIMDSKEKHLKMLFSSQFCINKKKTNTYIVQMRQRAFSIHTAQKDLMLHVSVHIKFQNMGEVRKN